MIDVPRLVSTCVQLTLLNEWNRLFTEEEEYAIDYSNVSSMDDLAERMWNIDRLDYCLTTSELKSK